MFHRLKQKWQRLLKIVLLMLLSTASLALILYAFQTSILFFYTPCEFLKRPSSQQHQRLRLGGLVKEHSFQTCSGVKTFILKDTTHEVPVQYQGVLPDLFREGQGVVAEGAWDTRKKHFHAEKIFAKHDETYMPRELVKTLKEKGQWQHSPPSF